MRKDIMFDSISKVDVTGADQSKSLPQFQTWQIMINTISSEWAVAKGNGGHMWCNQVKWVKTHKYWFLDIFKPHR